MVKSELRSRSSSYNPRGNQTRLDHTRLISYDKGMWSTAQTKMSTMRKYCKSVTIEGTGKWFHERDQRQWERKKPGLQPTPLKNQGYRRRLLQTFVYHDGAVADHDDTPESLANYFQDVAVERAHSLARLIDQKILQAFLDPVIYEGDASPKSAEYTGGTQSTPTLTDDKKRVTALGYNQGRRDIFFVKKQSADVSSQQNVFTPDDLEDIRNIFLKRNLGGKLCITLTPNLQTLMRKDPKFQNLENAYTSASAANAASGMGFDYRGITFVAIQEDALCPLTAAADNDVVNQVDVGRFGSNGTFIVSCRTLDITDGRLLRGRNLTNSDAMGYLKPATDAGTGGKTHGTVTAGAGVVAVSDDLQTQRTSIFVGETRHLVTTKTEDVVYVWTKSGIGNPLMFARRNMLNMKRMAELQEWSFAKLDYAKRAFGVMLRDEDYVMAVPIAASKIDVA